MLLARSLLGLAAVLSTTLAAEQARPSFAKQPAASRQGDMVTVSFAASRETDVAVYVENAKGKAVRHLVAGVLGKNPPEPLRASSLEQSVLWDGKDDGGRPAGGGPFRVRVGLGLRPVFDRTFPETGAAGRKNWIFLLGLDRQRELVYATSRGHGAGYCRYDGRTGEMQTVNIRMAYKANQVTEITVGPRGEVVGRVPGEVGRIDWLGTPWPFPAAGSYIARIPDAGCLKSYLDRGHCVAPSGDVYAILRPRANWSVSVLSADGRLLKEDLIGYDFESAPAGIRVDRAGNIYIADHLKPRDRLVPAEYAGKRPLRREDEVVRDYGSIFKFGPKGGRITRSDGAGQPGARLCTTAEGRGSFAVEGALWQYFGTSHIPPALDRGWCYCHTPRFDLDGFARLFVPDQIRGAVQVLDTNGNPVTRFGVKPGTTLPAPGGEVPLGDPRTVMVSEGAAYVGDEAHNRIVRARLEYAAVEACNLPDLPAPAPAPAASDELAGRLAELRREALALAPSLGEGLDWAALEQELRGRGTPISLNDARVALCLALRGTVKLPAGEARALLARHLAAEDPEVRLGAVWGLDAPAAEPAAGELLRKALGDEKELVAVTAAVQLFHRGNQSGVRTILGKGLSSKDAAARHLAETAFLADMTEWAGPDTRANEIYPKARAPKFPVGDFEIDALAPLLEGEWYLQRAAAYCLGLSANPRAVAPLRSAVKKCAPGANLCRMIGALKMLRAREAVPDLLAFLTPARVPAAEKKPAEGEEAEAANAGPAAANSAAVALAHIAAPESVGPLIALLDAQQPATRELARRTLSRIFDDKIPADQCLLPKDSRLVPVRVSELPDPGKLREAWEVFWEASAERYEWNPDGPPLRRKAGPPPLQDPAKGGIEP